MKLGGIGELPRVQQVVAVEEVQGRLGHQRLGNPVRGPGSRRM